MSHHIVYEQLAVRFPKEALVAAIDDWSFYEDCYLLLELGGSNNCTTQHPATWREVGSRDWYAAAYGRHYEVMRETVKLAASCEGGGMRLSGERRTLPESYIRRTRNVLKNPVLWTELSGYGIALSTDIPVPDDSGQGWADDEKAPLNRYAHIIEKPDGCVKRSHWHLNAGRSGTDAALLMLYGHRVSASAWNVVSVDGPRFECEGGYALFKRLRNRQAA